MIEALTNIIAGLVRSLPLLMAWLAGKERQKAGDLEKAIDNAREAGRIDENVARMSDAALDRELYGNTKPRVRMGKGNNR